MTDTLNWDEFRIVKAIADTQSLAGAAERLGFNHSTMFRHLTALETRLGTRLFERERSGYRPTAAGEDMVSLATLMGQTIAEFERRVAGNDLKLSGTLRLTTLSSLGCLMLPEIVADLLARHPNLHIEFVLGDTTLDLMRGEADLALRAVRGRPADGLQGRRVARMGWAIFAARSLIERNGEFNLAKAPWIAASEMFGPRPLQRWLERNVEPWRRVATASNDIAMAELAARGVGVALLPRYVGAAKPELQCVGLADPDIDRDLWLLAHPHALRAPRVRALFDLLGDELERRRSIFEGETHDDHLGVSTV